MLLTCLYIWQCSCNPTSSKGRVYRFWQKILKLLLSARVLFVAEGRDGLDLMKQMSRAEVPGTMRGVEEIGVECILTLFSLQGGAVI